MFVAERKISSFSLNDIKLSKVYYKPVGSSDQSQEEDSIVNSNDFAVLSFISSADNTVHNVLIVFELLEKSQQMSEIYEQNKANYPRDNLFSRSLKDPFFNSSLKTENERNIRDYESKQIKDLYLPNSKIPPRKTIFIQPSEAIKLTSNELKPKKLNSNSDKLIYFLVSGSPKFGELKLKRVLSNDETPPQGWNQVNDIYLEKSVKEFTQQDLDNGNVWYEPFNDLASRNDMSDCNNSTKDGSLDKPCEDPENCESRSKECEELAAGMSSSDPKNNIRYDHCMFEVRKSFVEKK